MNDKEMEYAVKKIEATRHNIIELMAENDIEPNEALSLLSGMLVQFYCGLVEDASRDNFVGTMTECYDAFSLLSSEPEGSIH